MEEDDLVQGEAPEPLKVTKRLEAAVKKRKGTAKKAAAKSVAMTKARRGVSPLRGIAQEAIDSAEAVAAGGHRTGRWTPPEKMKALDMYIMGHPFEEIAGFLHRDIKEVRRTVNSYQRSLTQTKMVRLAPMMHKERNNCTANTDPHQAVEYSFLTNPELINEEFFKLLSDPEASIENLTPAEVKFCWAYVSSMDLEEAIYASGLDAGLYMPGDGTKGGGAPSPIKGFQACIKMRISYLKTKPNLAYFIKKIRAEAVFNVDVDKDFLQKEIMTQIEGLRLNTTMEGKKLMRDYIMMLGKTFGGFVDKLEVQEVDHAKTIERLMKASRRKDQRPLLAEAERAKIALEEAARMRVEEEAEEKALAGADTTRSVQ